MSQNEHATASQPQKPELSDEEIVAHFVSPERATTRTIIAMGDEHLGSIERPDLLIKQVRARIDAAASGDMKDVCRMLASQILTLERMAQHLFARASHSRDNMNKQERYLRLAMRAQAQSLRTALAVQQMADKQERRASRAITQSPGSPSTPSRTQGAKPVHQETKPTPSPKDEGSSSPQLNQHPDRDHEGQASLAS